MPRIIMIKMVMGRKVLQVVSSYAHQGERLQEEKEKFWRKLDDTIGRIPEEELLMIGGDLDGQLWRNRSGFEKIMETCGYGGRNADGESILECCQS